VHGLTLLKSVYGRDPDQGTAYSEVVPPLTFIRAIEKRQPELLDRFRCLSTRRSVVKLQADGTFKLITIDDEPDELFDLAADPLELEDISQKRPLARQKLTDELQRIQTGLEAQRIGLQAGTEVEMDEALIQRLRGLGYID
jgi:hypothetical protein